MSGYIDLGSWEEAVRAGFIPGDGGNHEIRQERWSDSDDRRVTDIRLERLNRHIRVWWNREVKE
jgi:hypothetical protein